MRNLTLVFLLLGAFEVLSAQAPTALIKKATVLPVIDGVIDSVWTSANKYNIDKPFQSEMPTLGEAGSTTWKALWSPEGIYILLQVNDNIFFPSYNGAMPLDAWEYDLVEIYFDVNQILHDGNGVNNPGHYQINSSFVISKIDGTPIKNSFGVISAFLVTNPTYVAEYFIPFYMLLNNLGGEMNKNAPLGFDISIIDRDVEEISRSRAVWSNIGTIAESYFNMDECGTIMLDTTGQFILSSSIDITSAGNITQIETDDGILQMNAIIYPENALIHQVNWTVLNGTGRAAITSDGLLIAKVNGKVTVIATSKDGANITAYKEITISHQIATLASVSIIKEGDFPTDGPVTGAWKSFSRNGGTAQVVDGVCEMTPSPNDREFFDLIVYQTGNEAGWTVNNDSSYFLIFDAWSDAERDFDIDFEDRANNFNRFGVSTDEDALGGMSEWNVKLTTSRTTYTRHVTFKTVRENTKFNLQIMTGAAQNVVYIDNIYLIPSGDWPLISTHSVKLDSEKIITCGDSLKLNPTLTYNGDGDLTYLWSPSEGLNATNIPYPVSFTKKNIKYTLSVTASDFGTVKDSVLITVNPLTLNSGADKTIICGGKIQLSNPITNYSGSGSLSYSWLPSIGLSSTIIAQPTVEITTNTSYTLEINTPNGCKANDTVTINVNPLTVNTGADKSIVCGGKVQLSNTISNYSGSGSLSYSWFPANGLNSANIAQPTAEVSTSTSYALEITTPNGCKANDTVMIIVNPLITVVNDVNISCGNTGQLHATTNYTGLGSLTYNWIPATGLSASNIADPYVYLISDATYSVEVSTPNGCFANDSAVVDVSTITYFPSICMVTVDENDKNVIVIKKEQSNAVEEYFIYRESLTQKDQYDLIGQIPYSDNAVFVDLTSNAKVQSNKYRIAVKDICGFETDKSSDHKTMHLTINKGTGTNWNLIWEPYAGASVSGYLIYRGTAKSNLILIGYGSGSNTTYTDLTAPDGDVYYQIEGIMQEPCISLKSTEYSSVRSNIISNADATNVIYINQLAQEFIYPNPASEKLYIMSGYSTNAVIEIYNLQGKQVLNRQIKEQIDISGLSKGVYFVKLIDSGKVLVNKLVKE